MYDLKPWALEPNKTVKLSTFKSVTENESHYCLKVVTEKQINIVFKFIIKQILKQPNRFN